MKDVMKPIRTLVDARTGLLNPCDSIIERKLSDMQGMYANAEAYNELLNKGDKLVYKVYEVNIPQVEG